MKISDIKVGKQYQCKRGLGQTVTCRIIKKNLWGLLWLEQHGTCWDVGWPSTKEYGHVFFWQVIEDF